MTDARSYSTIIWPVSRRSERPRAGFPCGSAVGVEAVQYRLWRRVAAPIPTFTWTFRLSICAASRWYSWVSVDVPKGAGDANAVGCGTTDLVVIEQDDLLGLLTGAPGLHLVHPSRQALLELSDPTGDQAERAVDDEQLIGRLALDPQRV